MVLWIVYFLIATAIGCGIWAYSLKKDLPKDHLAPAIILIALIWPLILFIGIVVVIVIVLDRVLNDPILTWRQEEMEAEHERQDGD